MARSAKIIEQGNGFPTQGQIVGHPESGEVYRVVSELGPIQTNDNRGNYCWADVEPADWDDVPVGTDPIAICAFDGRRYVVRTRIAGSQWSTDDPETYESREAAQRAADELARREPTNDDGQALEYSVFEA